MDEAGQYPAPDLLDIMRSNMRGPIDIPVRMVIAANPGGPGHHWIAKRYVFTGKGPWDVFTDAKSKRQWIYAPSTFQGNEFIDRDQYRDQLEAACPHDPELLRAWTEGDWAVARGAYFAAVLDDDRNAVDAWETIPKGWRTYLTHDFGSSAPSVTYIVAESPGDVVGGRFYPKDSLVFVDELATVQGEQYNTGLGWIVPILAEEIRGMCDRWRVSPRGVADDAIFAKTGSGSGSIADEFRRAGVAFSRAHKADRISGWQRMKRLL